MLNRIEAKELQDKLIIIYKFISQQKHLKRFFDYNPPEQSELIKRLLKSPGAEKILKEAILELEKIIDPGVEKSEDLFYHVLNREDVEFMARRYGMRDSWDFNKLNIEKLLKRI
ncbi:MAG TPA: hypothetical protein HA298_00580 [Methanobacteriales archaeon]|nr:MAG: Uncharacterized protein XD44_1294 [Methanobacteriaceae archaeon 41_258]MBC7089735.1 hypothetical protein [Methanobacteriaceae archaeon]MBC7096882.1 hypothetical protein [Methanobacteriales archaeon]HIH61176.1 hypothetical protein [Methanobacteriales archaeon]